MFNKEDFQTELLEVRKRKGISRKDMARLLHTSPTGIDLIEKGNPSLINLVRYLDVIGLDLNDIFIEQVVVMKKLYLGITNDKYELPVAVASTLAELSIMTGISTSGLSIAIKENRKCNNEKWRFIIVEVENERN